MGIKDYIAKLKKADKAYINEQLLRIVQEESVYAIGLNTSQLLSGVDANNKKLKPYKNNNYAKKKNLLNAAPGFGIPDDKLTGSFQDNFYLIFKARIGWPVSFYSRDNKTEKLVARDKDIFGLTPDNLTNFSAYVRPKVKKLFAGIFKV